MSLFGALPMTPVFTAPMPIAADIGKTRVLLSQSIGIILWFIVFLSAMRTMH